MFGQGIEHTDMGPTARRTAAQCQTYFGFAQRSRSALTYNFAEFLGPFGPAINRGIHWSDNLGVAIGHLLNDGFFTKRSLRGSVRLWADVCFDQEDDQKMTIPSIQLSRRQAMAGAGGLGLAASASLAVSAGPLGSGSRQTPETLKGPYLDLTKPNDNMIAYARLLGDLDTSKTRYGWYSGVVQAVVDNKKLEDLFIMQEPGGFNADLRSERFNQKSRGSEKGL